MVSRKHDAKYYVDEDKLSLLRVDDAILDAKKVNQILYVK
jgi:hypothetical protein